MSPLEIVLIIVGIITFVASFMIPEKGMTKKQEKISRDQIKKICEKEMAVAKQNFESVREEQGSRTVEKTERELEKISNQKIMAVSEYSDTVLAEIDKTHKEVVFLHSMMCDKEQSVKDMLIEISQYVKEMEQIKKDIVAMTQDSEKLNQTMENAQKEMEKTKNSILKELYEMESRVHEKTDRFLQAENREAHEEKTDSLSESFMPELETQNVVSEKKTATKEHVEKIKIEEEPVLSMEKEQEPEELKKNEKVLFAEIGNRANKREEIMELQKQGLDAVEIAKQLGIGTGEVKLVLDLYAAQSNAKENAV